MNLSEGPTRWIAATTIVAASAAGALSTASRTLAAPQAPTVRDERLALSLFAADPDIATPIGIAIDDRDRLFVLESHTHLQASDYAGPRSDRIKLFVDDDRDGKPDRITVFADGIEDGLNVAFSPAGELYVVTSRAVWALHDRDKDAVSEARTRVLALVKPASVYDHAALLGIAFSPDGWMYISRGNTGGASWRLEGTDGSALRGFGDGGNIMRSRPDGSGLEEVATGFWNPFALTFDVRGRLLVADNDPDSRGPNRLVHVIPGGDYGYKSLYGGSGIHPYLAWNGELPGTLPFAAPLGEAPSGILVAAAAALPPDYRDQVLVTIWEERTIVRVPLAARGVSVSGEPQVLIEGGEGFRPVAFAADRNGTIYVTDWVLRAYPNHGKGRIWRLATKPDAASGRPRAPSAPPDPDPGAEPLRRLYAASSAADFDRVRDGLAAPDPFLRSAAVTVLSRPIFRDQVVAATTHADPRVRVGAVLALHRSRHPGGEVIARTLLRDPDPLVRRMTLIWIGSAGMSALRTAVDEAITDGPASPELFDVYLATLEQLSPEFIAAYRSETQPYARLLKRVLRSGFIESFITDESRPVALRALAVTRLEKPASHVALLVRLSSPANALPLRLEAVRSLSLVPGDAAGEALLQIARDPSNPAALRAEALLGLARTTSDASSTALALLDASAPDVRLEAARYLRSKPLPDTMRESIRRKVAALTGTDAGALRAQLAFAVPSIAPGPRPATPDEWQTALGEGGDPAAGRRVLFSTQSACSQCHAVERRGGDLGPDLTNIGRSKTRRQIVDAILRPSAEISPEYQGWFIKTKDGQIHTGRQIDVGDRGKAELYMLSGEFATFENIDEYGPMPQSLMPAGLERNLTVDDLRDLLAFLTRGQ